MKNSRKFSLIGFLCGCLSLVLLPFLAVYNTMGFLFYASILAWATWSLSFVIEFPFSLALAVVVVAAFWLRRSYRVFERWIIRNSLPRTILLLAHGGAGVLCGRLAGFHLHGFYGATTPVITFQVIGAAILAWINIIQFLNRSDLSLAKCLSPRHVVR